MPFDVRDDLKSLKNRNMSHKGGGVLPKTSTFKIVKIWVMGGNWGMDNPSLVNFVPKLDRVFLGTFLNILVPILLF